MNNLPEYFGMNVFCDKVMKERLPNDVYEKLKEVTQKGSQMDIDLANVVADAMKNWAIDKGATHFTHWFQPMTGITAEKHDSFITPTADGSIIMSFSGKALIRGEPDASALPTGGLRATFEARGYTSWDPTSYAFIKDGVLCIPTAFCSYSGEVLDKKTPLLRSMEIVNQEALRLLKLLGNKDVDSVSTMLGAEQEYFLIDREVYEKRPDLKLCGRTLIGAKSPKGQELEDHYFGAIRPRVHAFMKELDLELWRLGVMAKTEHNEAAPSQHELAPVYTNINIACDHNQLTMEFMKKVAGRHGLACLLHEKPFEGVNGSGKHSNWSLQTDTGFNLFEPGNSPEENAQFLLFLVAVVAAVDEYADLLRVSVSTAANDHRLGANEAPPTIISMFLGEDLTSILDSMAEGKAYDKQVCGLLKTGASVLPFIPKDTSDRNRTSPFAFTGNKFEFRAPGSSLSITGPNIVLNTAVAEILSRFSDELEKSQDISCTVDDLIIETYKKHKRIVFNGNSYSQEWKAEESIKRGLPNFKSSAEALPLFKAQKNVDLFEKHEVFTKAEVESRCELMLENYNKTLNIEAQTMIIMIKRDVLPAVSSFTARVIEAANAKRGFGKGLSANYESELAGMLTTLCDSLYKKVKALERASEKAKEIENTEDCALFYSTSVIEKMNAVRQVADELETLVDSKLWPYPAYSKLLFSV
ncbi:MAG: glutamine synthetase type III [Clostridiales bacterium]|nr:glutamine synthetase type III [Clostridiales bacterium]